MRALKNLIMAVGIISMVSSFGAMADTRIPIIELNGKGYNISESEKLLKDLSLNAGNYEDNVVNSEKRLVLGEVERFKGLKVGGIDISSSMADLKRMGAEILDKDVASLNDTTFYFDKDGKLETILINK